MAHSDAFVRQRRRLLLGATALGAAGALAWLRPEARRDGHHPYFQALDAALSKARLATPTLVLDQARLEHNLSALNSHLNGEYHYRIVVKSLPSLPLLQRIMAATGSNRLMVFHQPFLNTVAETLPQADVLMGKPLPVAAVDRFYQQLISSTSGFRPEQQLQWLVDSRQRLEAYEGFARAQQRRLRINLEIDVGLHRGGFTDTGDLARVLTMIERSPWLSFSGFMGYEPHIMKAPGPAAWLRDRAMARYQDYVSTAEQHLGRSLTDLTLNTGGSTTYQLYRGLSGELPVNELSAGSGLVMPTDFDLPTLSDHRPAAFIATPVLKLLESTRIPGAPGLGRLQALWNPNRARTAFIYGGNWPATPVSPAGLTPNPVYGRSSNQEMLNFADGLDLAEGDRVFLRPHQSESVFLQFGDLAVFDPVRGAISDRWPVFREG
jgi:D-serine deaminase-like pyridoxal phosphate-dependent protein